MRSCSPCRSSPTGRLAAARLAARVGPARLPLVVRHLHHDLAICGWRMRSSRTVSSPPRRRSCTDARVRVLATRRAREGLRLVADAIHFAIETGDLAHRAAAHHAAAEVWGRHGDTVEALRHAAVRCVSTAHPHPVARGVRVEPGRQLRGRLGDFELAHRSYEAALSLFRAHRYRPGEATILDSLGRLADAVGHTEALRLPARPRAAHELGDTYAAPRPWSGSVRRIGRSTRTAGRHGMAAGAASVPDAAPDRRRGTRRMPAGPAESRCRTVDGSSWS